jgi:nicotinamidase-related amidase
MYKVLCIIDMQNDFVTGSLGNKECKEVVSKVVNVIETNDYDEIFLTRDTHDSNYLYTQEGKKLPVIHAQKDTAGWQIVNSVMEAVTNKYANDKIHIIDKVTFGSEKLTNNIKNLATKYYNEGLSVDFIGVCTGICVISNALPAKMVAPEADIRVIANACACLTPESHKKAIDVMKTSQVTIIE